MLRMVYNQTFGPHGAADEKSSRFIYLKFQDSLFNSCNEFELRAKNVLPVL